MLWLVIVRKQREIIIMVTFSIKKSIREVLDKSTGKMVDVVNVADLTPHPSNVKLYPPEVHEEDVKKIAETYSKEMEKTGIPNYNPIEICAKAGVIFSGHSRFLAAKRIGEEYLRVKLSDTVYDPTRPEIEQINILQSYNEDDGKRNESLPTTAVNVFRVMENAHFDEYRDKIKAAERNAFALGRSIDKDDFFAYLKIDKYDTDLLRKVCDPNDPTSFTEAKKIVNKGNKKPKKPVDPNKFNKYNYMIENPEIGNYIMVESLKYLDALENLKCGGILPFFEGDHSWEPNQKTGIISNVFMTTASQAFDKSGITARTPNKGGQPDISFPTKSRTGYEPDKLEIKAASWNKMGTKFYCSPFIRTMNPVDHLLVVHNEQYNKWLVLMTVLNPGDWSGGQKDATVSLQQWYDNHYKNTNEYIFLAGNIYQGNKGPEVKWAEKKDFLEENENVVPMTKKVA